MALITQRIISLLNERIKNEQQSSRIYKSMQNWLDLNGFIGAASLWGKYSCEELEHAEWSNQYLLDLNIKPITPSQEEPRLDFKGLPQIIALSYEHELNITNEVKALAKACMDEGDFMTFNLAQKYVWEQVNELAKMQLWIDMLNSFGEDKIALKLLDNTMGG